MKKLSLLLASCLAVFCLSGCVFYQAPVMPPLGGLFTDVSAPISTNFDQTKVATKHGKAQSISVLWILAMGDCSIQSAAKAGGLSTIHYADYSFMNVLGVFQMLTTEVHGE